MTRSTLEKRSLPSRSDRLTLLADARFHLAEAAKRLERLRSIEHHPENETCFGQAVAVLRGLRALVAEQEARQRAARMSRRERRERAA